MKDIKELATPCFVVETDKFRENINAFYKALNMYYKNAIVSYSVKTNSLPFLLNVAKESDCFCEVVSYDEYELAKKIGFDISRIIYNGPLKSKETFIEAIRQGAYVNIETQRELDWIMDCKDKIKGKIGLRLNINLENISPNDTKIGEGSSRFGFEYENGEFKKALLKLAQKGIKIDGVHVHRTSVTRSIEVYRNICNYTTKVISECELNLSYIDLGGGYYGDLVGKPTFEDYVNVISESLVLSKDITVIVEPGNALVASAVKFITSVIDIKYIDNDIILNTDGSRFDIDPLFHKEKYRYELITESKEKCKNNQKLAGCTCIEKDIITTLEDEKTLNIGDKIVFMDQGAYTMTFTPNFIRLLPKVYAFENGNYYLVRSEFTVSTWISNSICKIDKNVPAILFSNAGRRTKLIKNFKESLGNSVKLIATDNWCVASALFAADDYYITTKITDNNYVDNLINICKEQNVKAITTCIDPEIEILAKNREIFIKNGIIPLCPDKETAALCFDKYKMFKYLFKNNISTVLTFENVEEFDVAYKDGKIDFPVFIKPRCGSGSVGIAKIENYEELQERVNEGKFEYIIQEYMDGEDFDADVYIDTISNKVVSIFMKKKIETRIGGASKTISFKDYRLFDFILEIVKLFKFYGPIDMDFFYKNGEYYLSEINPRFGGAYLHAYGAGVDFPKLIRNNINGIENKPDIGNYDEDVIMIMYDDVIITNKDKIKGDYSD